MISEGVTKQGVTKCFYSAEEVQGQKLLGFIPKRVPCIMMAMTVISDCMGPQTVAKKGHAHMVLFS